MKFVKLFWLLGLVVCAPAMADEVEVNCDGAADGNGMTCTAHTTNSTCAGLEELAPQVCQGFANIVFDPVPPSQPGGCTVDATGSSVKFTCSN